MSGKTSFIPDKRQVRRGFERAAARYDSAAFLQREVADRMLVRLEYMKLEPKRIVDVGCGTGYGTRKLAGRYPKADIIALDLARNMLCEARAQAPWWKRHLSLPGVQATRYLCADMEQLPLAARSAGLLWSNLVLLWCDLERSVSEAHRVLEDNGLIVFTTLGPDTLKELRHAFTGVDGYEHVNRFIDMHDVGDVLVQAGFADPVMDMEIITVTFDGLPAMMRDLKTIGAGNRLMGRARGLMTPRRWRHVAERYETERRDGKLPVTIEVVYGHAWKAPARVAADGRQIIQFKKPAR